MAKKVLTLTLITTFLLVGSAVAELSKTAPMVNHRHSTGEEAIDIENAIPYNPGLATDSPGDIVGYTYYDYQSNGSTGNRMAVYDDNSKIFSFMRAAGWPYPDNSTRYVYYNWVSSTGGWHEAGGSQVSENSGSGYTTLDTYGDGLGVFFYHYDDEVIVSITTGSPDLGLFSHYTAPNVLYPQTTDSPGICLWPYGTVDAQNYIHIAATENTDKRLQRLGYTRSEDGGANWTDFTFVDTVMVIGAVMASSPVSNRVALAYPKTQDTSTQWNNDIVYYVSDDGTTWNWRSDRINITNYGDDNDSLWAYTDLDVMFDYNDNIQIIWNDQWLNDESIYYRTFLRHYSEATEQITIIKAFPDSTWGDIAGNWNRPMCKMSLGANEETGALYATWTQFDTADVSANGYGNGDLYAAASSDGGLSWSESVNMTNSATPGCFSGDCDSDHWSSLAERVDDSLHVFYVNDKDAGGIPQEEGAGTLNPMRYMRFPASEVLTSVDDVAEKLPTSFALNQNYPNPFNASTTISFNLETASDVTVNVYNITGAKVTTLVNEYLPAGQHQVNWNASNVASGIYYYKLAADGLSETRQAVLIK